MHRESGQSIVKASIDGYSYRGLSMVRDCEYSSNCIACSILQGRVNMIRVTHPITVHFEKVRADPSTPTCLIEHVIEDKYIEVPQGKVTHLT